MFVCGSSFIRMCQMKQMGPISSASISNFKIEFHLCVYSYQLRPIHHRVISSQPVSHYWFGCWGVPRKLEEFLVKTSLSEMPVSGPEQVSWPWSLCQPRTSHKHHPIMELENQCSEYLIRFYSWFVSKFLFNIILYQERRIFDGWMVTVG